MLNRPTVFVAACAAVMLTSATLSGQDKAIRRYTFTAANAATKATLPSDGRLSLVVNRWSHDEERQRIANALKEKNFQGFCDAVWSSGAVGYLHWPGNLSHTLRYAASVSRPDGGEDVLVAADWRVTPWWDSTMAKPADGNCTLIHIRLSKDGRGEGKLSDGTTVSVGQGGVTLQPGRFEQLPVVLTDVRSERASS